MILLAQAAHYQRVSHFDFYKTEVYNALVNRLHGLTPQAQRQWGSMSVSQMLHHLNLAIGSGLGFFELPNASNFLSRNMSPFLVLHVLKRFPKGTPTATPLLVKEEYDFDLEKKLLLKILDRAFHTRTDADWGSHTYFGAMSREAWGRLVLIHCNHHFQQFGV